MSSFKCVGCDKELGEGYRIGGTEGRICSRCFDPECRIWSQVQCAEHEGCIVSTEWKGEWFNQMQMKNVHYHKKND